MKFDFDIPVDRHGTGCLKYDFAVERGKPADILPLWVADMDFQTAPGIIERLKKAVDHGIFGYSDTKEDYFEAMKGWYQKHFGFAIEKDWLVKTPGIVFALAMAVRAFTKEGDGVLIQQPVYYPFSGVIEANGRRIVNSPLRLKDGRYEMDFADLEKKIEEEQVKLFLLCSPHNPVGRVWTEEELRKAGEICLRHGVFVVSDEIHSDFTYPGHTHHMFASLSPEFAANSIVCTAPSKTFNLAGLQVSNILIPGRANKEKFLKEMAAAGYSQLNGLGLAACQAAYETGEEWLEAVKEYIRGNLDFVRGYLAEKLPQVTLVEPEGTYLLWLDFRGLGLSEEELEKLIVEKAGLWLDPGAIFGPAGAGFERFNIACRRETLELAFEKLRKAITE